LERDVGEVIRELELPVDGHFMVRIYAASSNGRWHAWLESISLAHGDLSRSGVIRSADGRDELRAWARGLGDEELRRALEDAEIIPARELGRIPEGVAFGD
jgi:hypothetical protein